MPGPAPTMGRSYPEIFAITMKSKKEKTLIPKTVS
jgi:hypothetical protein